MMLIILRLMTLMTNADDANLTLKSDQSTLEVVVLGMIDGFAFGKGIDGRKTMGGWKIGGRGSKKKRSENLRKYRKEWG